MTSTRGSLGGRSAAVDGTIRDTAYFSIIRVEWPQVRHLLRERLRSLPGR